MKLSDIATKIGARLEGGDLEIRVGRRALKRRTPGALTFIANPKYVPLAKTTKAAAVIVDEKISVR